MQVGVSCVTLLSIANYARNGTRSWLVGYLTSHHTASASQRRRGLPGWSNGGASTVRVGDAVITACFPLSNHSGDIKVALWWLPCCVSGVVGSELGLVVPVLVCCKLGETASVFLSVVAHTQYIYCLCRSIFDINLWLARQARTKQQQGILILVIQSAAYCAGIPLFWIVKSPFKLVWWTRGFAFVNIALIAVRIGGAYSLSTKQGPVQFYNNGTWFYICDTGFDDVTAR